MHQLAIERTDIRVVFFVLRARNKYRFLVEKLWVKQYSNTFGVSLLNTYRIVVSMYSFAHVKHITVAQVFNSI